jgi:hypothetical protein
MAKSVKAKGSCCKDRPRCKKCPVVLKKLESAGLAQRVSKREYLVGDVPRPALAAARHR